MRDKEKQRLVNPFFDSHTAALSSSAAPVKSHELFATNKMNNS